MAVASVSDVGVELGRTLTDDAEIARITVWLERAERQIVARLGPVSELDEATVRDVETMAVAAKATNPDGAQSETIDDYTYRLPAETRRVTILDEWWDMLSPATSSSHFSLRPSFEPDSTSLADLDWS